jgi:DNA-binding Lrp family transcriptional regulator
VETAIVLIDAAPAAIASLGPRLASLDGVSEVYSVTGGEDLVAIVRVTDHDRIATIVTEEIAQLDGVRGTRTLIAFRQYDPADSDF